jgi:hypothetical protein
MTARKAKAKAKARAKAGARAIQGSLRYALRASVEMTELAARKADSSAALRNDSQKGKSDGNSNGGSRA